LRHAPNHQDRNRPQASRVPRAAGWILGSILALAAGILAGAPATVRDESADAPPSLGHDIAPILKAHCLKCHGPNKPKGKLNLASPTAMARGGAGGPAVVPGKPDESLLWDQVSSGEMPPEPEEPLSDSDKAAIRRWIERGAEGLPDPAAAARTSPGSDHWAFAPPTHPRPPSVRDGRRVRGPVDRFIQRSLESRGLTLGPEAHRAALIRRLSFDLTGLPPSPAEIAAFLEDPEPDAYDRLVDRLLASPHYGERWGKHWLDASGYADSNGYFSADTDRPLAHRYRDYVIRAFNADRPLDQVVREQLAGDELAAGRRGPGTPAEVVDQLTATHFLRNSQDGTGESDGNPDEVRADKYAVLEGTGQVIASSLLGLTIQCARCHDHKFEPITQEDYYRLQAILYPAFNVEHWVKPNDRVVVAGPRAELLRWEANEKTVDAELSALRRSFITGSEKEKKAREEALKSVIEAIESRRRPNPGRIAWVGDVSNDPPEIPVLVRGVYNSPGRKVGPAPPAFLSDPDNPYKPDPAAAGTGSTGRRLALARWLTRPGSRPAALLARVLANRVWQEHFGTGLVATPENLGYTGAPPSHPELLEFLASELARSGWRAKALHRLIVNSSAYRQSSAPCPEAARVDPENRLLARYPLRRLDAESIRDAMLAATGELDPRIGGPYIPTDRTGSGEVAVEASTPGAARRSVYLRQRRTELPSLLEVFDAPSIVTTCTRRQPSTVPLQSLSLLNSDFVAARAAKLAERLGPECDHCSQDDDRIDRAFLLVAGRPPTAAGRNASGRFLREQPARYPNCDTSEATRRAFVDFCQMLLASNAFLYVE
jgi:hypothetical protein